MLKLIKNIGKLKLAFYIAPILFTVFNVFAFQKDEAWEDMSISQSGDTIVAKREMGRIKIGAFAGPDLNYHFGKFYSFENPLLAESPYNRKLSFNSAIGSGWFLGLLGEYVPVDSKWGYGLKLSVLDLSSVNIETNNFGDSLKTYYEMQNSMNYLTISPYARYNLPITGFYTFAGLDVGINLNSENKQRKRFTNTGSIDQFNTLQGINYLTIYGANLGVAYEVLVADVNKKFRAEISPFASINFGTNLVDNLGSSWNKMTVRVGVSFKFSKDEIKYDTIPVNPNIIDRPVYYATAKSEFAPVSFPGFTHSKPITADLVYLATPQIVEEIKVDNQFKEEVASVEPQVRPTSRIVPNVAGVYSFDKVTDTELSKDMIVYLNSIAQYLMANPKAEVRITGHSDNQGSIEQNTQRSKDRAIAAANYLINKKQIKKNRILYQFKGSIKPIAPNDTEKNRKKNRRIEIVVVPK